ncbi:MAG: NAD-dependent epimerase/dehydratase family protein [Myxococcales bacterium]|nr:NAD-dependent epimerase/dehydratase family protein [Myxococcales bacterium]
MAETTTRSIPQGKTLVTGAGGHVGANLVRALLAEGVDVRVLVHPQHNNRGVEGLPVERMEGDLRDAEAVTRAVQGCVRVYHAGAKVSVTSPSARQTREIWEINVLGTRNVMQAALRTGVARVCLTSSFSTVGYHLDDPQRPADEEVPFYPFAPWMPYSRTKVLAEVEAFKAISAGLDAVIAISTGVCGPHDYMPSRTGNVLVQYAQGNFKNYIPGGYEAVGVGDLARGHILAMERGRTGRRYTISTRFVEMEEMLALFAEVTGKKYKVRAMPPRLMSAMAKAISGPMTKLFPDVPQHLTPGAVLVLTLRRRADITRAREELGYVPGAIEPVVREWYEFFVREGMIKG